MTPDAPEFQNLKWDDTLDLRTDVQLRSTGTCVGLIRSQPYTVAKRQSKGEGDTCK